MNDVLMGALIGGGIGAGVGLIVYIIFAIIKKGGSPKNKADNVRIVDGVRYTTNGEELNSDGSVKITHKENDVVLERGVTYSVMRGGKIIPGKYIVLSANEGASEFNVRLGGFVRPLKHASDLVLAEGDEICAVSHTIILR